MQIFVWKQQRTDTHRQAGKQASLVQFSWPPYGAASRRSKERRWEKVGVFQPSLGGVGVTGVQAGLCGCRGAAVVCSRWAVEGLRAPPQVLQGLKEGAPCPLLLQGRGTLFFYLCNLSEGDRLCFEASLPRSAWAALASRRSLWDRQLLWELLHGWGHKVGWQDVEARGLHNHLTHSSHWSKGSPEGYKTKSSLNQMN